MSEQFIKRVIVERTRAEISFEDGRTRQITSNWGDSQQGRGYDGGHWGPFPNFRDDVEKEILMAQELWSLPAATIRYYRETRTVDTIKRATDVKQFYSERRVVPL